MYYVSTINANSINNWVNSFQYFFIVQLKQRVFIIIIVINIMFYFFFQSPYFASMFSGSWREANEKVISVEITDPNITLDCEYHP